MVMSAFLGFLALTVVVATFYVRRSWSLWLGRSRGRRGGGEPGAAPLQVGVGARGRRLDRVGGHCMGAFGEAADEACGEAAYES
jgi:hypothetical protein